MIKRNMLPDMRAKLLLLKSLPGKSFAYMLDKNLGKINTALGSIHNKVLEHQNESFGLKGRKEYIEQLVVLHKQYGKLDEEGRPVYGQEGLVFVDDDAKSLFEMEVKALESEHQSYLILKAYHDRDLAEYLDTEREIVLYKCRWSDVPENITQAQLEVLKELGVVEMPIEENNAIEAEF